MACTATIQSISLIPDGTGVGIVYGIQVLFNDSVSGFTQTKDYNFPITETIAAAKAAVQNDLNGFKILIANTNSLQQYVGTELT